MSCSLLCFLLNIEAGARIVAEVDDSRKSIETVTHRNVERLTKYPITLLRVRDDLRIASRHVKHDRVLRACDLSSHFDI